MSYPAKLSVEEAILASLMLAKKREMGEVPEVMFIIAMNKLVQDHPDCFGDTYRHYRKNGVPRYGLLEDMFSRLGVGGFRANAAERCDESVVDAEIVEETDPRSRYTPNGVMEAEPIPAKHVDIIV